jgi:hypothetical protein
MMIGIEWEVRQIVAPFPCEQDQQVSNSLPADSQKQTSKQQENPVWQT